jgi:hypothetical protein
MIRDSARKRAILPRERAEVPIMREQNALVIADPVHSRSSD